MPDRLEKTLAGLRALSSDHRSGAAEIADRAAALLEDFCAGGSARDPRLSYALGELAETTLRVQPSLAPLLNLANRLQLAAERPGRSLPSLRAALAEFRRRRPRAARRIARLFARRLHPESTVVTYSYSTTVAAALEGARRRLKRVIVAESRPMLEGRLLADRLTGAGIAVALVIDAALAGAIPAADAVVVGADAVFAESWVNKVGTAALQQQAEAARKPFFILADTSKFLPPALARFYRIEEKPAHELWRGAPAQVTIVNRYFETVPFGPEAVLLSEPGPLAPARRRALFARQPVAQRWTELPTKAGA